VENRQRVMEETPGLLHLKREKIDAFFQPKTEIHSRAV
jgi:hypothetical protein